MNDPTGLQSDCRRKSDRRRGTRRIRERNSTPSLRAIQQAKLLTRRERDVLLCMVDGRTDREIAASLKLSEKTVQHHVGALLVKLGAKNRTQAVVKALLMRLIDVQSITKN